MAFLEIFHMNIGERASTSFIVCIFKRFVDNNEHVLRKTS